MSILPQLPNSDQVKYQLEQAIRTNKRPQMMLFEFLSSGTKEANFLANTMISNRAALLVLTSPKGRFWLHRWLDDTLNYLQKFAEQAGQ